MFTDVLIIIVPEFLSELEKFSLTPVFLFRVSCYHLFFQNLSLVVLVSSQSSPTSPPTHTHSLTPFDQRTRPSTSSPCSLFLVQMPASPSCRAPRPPPRTVPYSPGWLLSSRLRVPTSLPPPSLPWPGLLCLSESFPCSSSLTSCHRGRKRGHTVAQLSKHWT